MASAMSAVSSALRVSEAAGKGKGASRGAPGSGEANVVDGHGAKRGHVDAERVQIFKGLTAQELSADFMARRGLAFDQRNASSLAGERDGSGTACHSTTEDENFILQRNPDLKCDVLTGISFFESDTLELYRCHALRRIDCCAGNAS